MQAVMGIPSSTASTLCIVGSPFASRLAVSRPLRPLHPSPRILSSNCRLGLHPSSLQGQCQRPVPCSREGRPKQQPTPFLSLSLPFLRCVSVSAC